MATTDKPARRRKKNDPSTTAALVALTENGLDRKDAGRVLGLTKVQVDRALDDARLELHARASEYATLHLEASREAAKKGKAEPMQWALERIGVVKPVEHEVGAKTGPIINIGIALPGLSADAGKAITVRAVDADPVE